MREKLYISVPEPCHEDWNKMTPFEQGRYCGSCKKNVIDFSNSNDEEMIDFFKNYNGSICGSFSEDQLNRPIEAIKIKKSSSFLKYVASLLFPATFLSSKGFTQKTTNNIIKGDTVPAVSTKLQNNHAQLQCRSQNKIIIVGEASSFTKTSQAVFLIRGKVIDSAYGVGLSGVSVFLVSNKNATVTNDEGDFTMLVPAKQKHENLRLSYIGYEQIEINISEKPDINEVVNLKTISLKRQEKNLEEVVVVGNMFRRRLGGVMGVSIVRTSVQEKVIGAFTPSKLKIYPNPVSPSGTINLSFSNIKPGQYQIRLINASGQLFYSFQKQISAKNDTEQVHLNNKMAAGIYFIQITDEQKKLVQSSKVIIQ